ncbi:aminodeoxychorismate/anthranilate synthase component II [Myxococcota bacterium]|nr:aminodeoxychorismate/anthranilate synthase component II [Myxococcota bacterium]
MTTATQLAVARVVLVDNYDSFTHNLYQYLAELGADVTVVENDERDLDGLRALAPTHVVLSPGPGSPDRPRDFGVCADVITTLARDIPVLGVCLGHQGIVHHLGGRILRAPEPVHGKTSTIRVAPSSVLFRGLAPELEVMRYHSLVVDRATLPANLRVTAETIEATPIVMAIEHDTWPLYGIQFHPESIGTPEGKEILARFLTVRR